MLPFRKTIHAHAFDFVAKDKLVVFARKHTPSALAYCAVVEMLDVFSLCSSRNLARTNSSPFVTHPYNQQPNAPRQTRPIPRAGSSPCLHTVQTLGGKETVTSFNDNSSTANSCECKVRNNEIKWSCPFARHLTSSWRD